jgi:hypothetical protein
MKLYTALKMEAADSAETLVSIYESIWDPEGGGSRIF